VQQAGHFQEVVQFDQSGRFLFRIKVTLFFPEEIIDLLVAELVAEIEVVAGKSGGGGFYDPEVLKEG